ncbi:MAG: hypothetical protein R3F07_16620 [Opitutaceae bacterium]
MPSIDSENLLLNGDFASWGRLEDAGSPEGLSCPTWQQTFLADRWKVRYAGLGDREVTQARADAKDPEGLPGYALELRGIDDLGQSVFVGQRIEAAEAGRYRRALRFSIAAMVDGVDDPAVPLRLWIGTARKADIFGNAFNDETNLRKPIDLQPFPAGSWVHLETLIDGNNLPATGLSVEIEIPAAILGKAGARLRLSRAILTDAETPDGPPASSAAIVKPLLSRFFQRHDASTVNSIGRALVVNAHELHFQFRFGEMRAFPACTLPREGEGLRIFDLDGRIQAGFTYDLTYRSRGSVILRASKKDHGLRDGFLSFVGYRAAILLDAEL